jgi:hypothetical protein
MFAYVDGCHSSAYVLSDFRLAWKPMVSGGVLAFDDYGYDLPNVTRTVNQILAGYGNEIHEIWRVPPKTVFLRKR